MKIALLPTTFSNHLAEATHITLILLAKELKKNGHDVYIISHGEKGFPKHELFKGISVYRGPIINCPPTLNNIISPILKIKEFKNKGIKFEILHSFSAAKFFVLKGALARKFINNKAKIIHTLRSYSFYKIGNAFTSLLNLADIVTVPTEVFAKKLIKKGCRKDKIRIIKSHINNKKFKPLNKQKSKTKVKIKNRFILYYGGTLENKGLKLLINAMKILLKSHKELKLVIIIRAEVPAEYKKLIKSLNMDKNVILIGKPIENIQDYVNAADIVALPYKDLVSTEGNPSCLLEAMACKTPVITTNLPELREILEPGKDVLIAKPGDVKSLSEEINRLLSSRKLQKKLAENAYKKSKQFNVKKITKQFIKLYQQK